MSVSGVTRTARIEAALGASYRRFAGHTPRAQRAADEEGGYVRETSDLARAPALRNSPAALLGALIERMGGGAGSRPRGSYVNLRV